MILKNDTYTLTDTEADDHDIQIENNSRTVKKFDGGNYEVRKATKFSVSIRERLTEAQYTTFLNLVNDSTSNLLYQPSKTRANLSNSVFYRVIINGNINTSLITLDGASYVYHLKYRLLES